MAINPFSFDAATPSSPDDVNALALASALKQKQTAAQQLMAQALKSDPVYGWKGAMSKLGAGALSGFYDKLDQDNEKLRQQALSQQLKGLFKAGVPNSSANPPGYTNEPPAEKGSGSVGVGAPQAMGPVDPNEKVAGLPDQAGQAYTGLIARGVHPVLAAAAAGNFGPESKWNPNAVGDKGTAVNLAQWRGERQQGLNEFAQARGTGINDFEAGLDHAADELTNPQSPYYKVAQQAIASGDPRKAADIFMRGYERPSDAAMAQTGPTRMALAERIYNHFKNQPHDVSDTPIEAAQGKTADASGTIVPSLDGAPGVETGEPEPTADAGSVTQAPTPETGPGSVGPNGGVMSAPTNQGSSMEMMRNEDGGGYVPAPPPRPDAKALASALTQEDAPAAPAGPPPAAMAAALKGEGPEPQYANLPGGAPIQGMNPGGPGLSAPPAGFVPPLPPPRPADLGQPQMAAGPEVPPLNGTPAEQGNVPDAGVKTAEAGPMPGRTRSLIPGALPEPRDPRLAPQSPAQAPQPAPQAVPPGFGSRQPTSEPAPPTQQQLTPRAQAALNVLVNPNQPKQAQEIAKSIWEQETQAGHEAYDRDGNRFWVVPGKKPELIMAKDKDDSQLVKLDNGQYVRVKKSEGGATPVEGLGPQTFKPMNSQMLEDGKTPNPNAAYMGPDGKPVMPFRDNSTKIENNVGDKGNGKAVELATTSLQKSHDGIQTGALPQLKTLDRMEGLLNKGTITGWGAEYETQVKNALLKIGIGDPEKVSNTQQFMTSAAQDYARLAKATFPQRVTNADLVISKVMAGTDPSYTAEALRGAIEMQRENAMMGIEQHNRFADKFAKTFPELKGMASLYKIDPEDYNAGASTPKGAVAPQVGATRGHLGNGGGAPEPTMQDPATPAPVVPPPGATIRKWNAAKGKFE